MAEMSAREYLRLQRDICNTKSCDECPCSELCGSVQEERTNEQIDNAVTAMEEYRDKLHPFGYCQNCGADFNSELVNEYKITNCPWCGKKVEG